MPDAAKDYLAARPALGKLFAAFREKYRSLGHFGGICLVPETATRDELRELSAFFRKEIGRGARLSFQKCERAWAATRFGEEPLPDFLRRMAQGNLRSRREEREELLARRTAILTRLSEKFPEDPAARWLALLMAGEKRLAQNADYLDAPLLETVARALSLLPETYERLPFFANRVTGNPHAFDEKEKAGHVFLQALGWLRGENAATPEERSELLYENHLLRDDTLNFATIYGLGAAPAPAYVAAAAREFAPLNLPLREIVRAEEFFPADGQKKNFPVFIVENSGVFGTLLDALQTAEKSVPLLCLHGQLKLASWALLARLARAGGQFFYSGDYDPEGLSIAAHIFARYASAQPWHFAAEFYAPQKDAPLLAATRLKKLAGISDPRLLPLANLLQKERRAYYQESFAAALLEDLWQFA